MRSNRLPMGLRGSRLLEGCLSQTPKELPPSKTSHSPPSSPFVLYWEQSVLRRVIYRNVDECLEVSLVVTI